MNERILVVGASGLLGGMVTRKLVTAGVPVRALSRDPARLATLAANGVEVVQGDLTVPDSLTTACAGIAQVFSTANSFMGKRSTSPTRIDVPGYRSLVGAARAAGVRRLVHTSAYGITRDSAVDYFRVKAEIDEVIRHAGMPFVLLKPSAFLDVWAGMLATEALAGRPVRIFGKGETLANYIAADDVAEFALRILGRPEVVGESIEVGGPSTISQNELVALYEAHLGRPVSRRQLPLAVLRLGSRLLRPFDELTARFMALGAWSAEADRRLDHWGRAAARFGVEPITAEAFIRSGTA